MSLISRVIAGGNTVHRQGPGQFGDLLDTVEVPEPQGQGLVLQVTGSGVIGELSGEGLIADSDLDVCRRAPRWSGLPMVSQSISTSQRCCS